VSIRVRGASDDLIEVDGDISEEFDALGNAATGGLLGFSNGTLLRVAYDEDGVWRITQLDHHGSVTIEHAPADDDENYSDVATLHAPADWVVYGTTWAHQ